MSYATIMVHLQVGRPNARVLAAAAELAQRHDARLVGIAANQPMILSDNGYNLGASVVIMQDEMVMETAEAEAEFRTAFAHAKHGATWRSTNTCAALSDYISSEARCADLIVTSPMPKTMFDAARHVNVGDLVMRAGCPVIIIPQAGATIAFDQPTVAWNDSREARRAVRDAMPLLKLATRVNLEEIFEQGDEAAQPRVDDVAAWLATHGITATTLIKPSVGDDANTLETILRQQHADMVVAGAYGHSRMREWAFGGVTRSILDGDRCALLSH